jgi:hypothetical protein
MRKKILLFLFLCGCMSTRECNEQQRQACIEKCKPYKLVTWNGEHCNCSVDKEVESSANFSR